MALSDAQIIARMRKRGISDDLGDDEIVEAIQEWTDYVGSRYPMETLGSFQTVANQQDYDLFGPTGPFPGGSELVELYSAPDGGLPALDVFGVAPLLYYISIVPPVSNDNYVFNIPGDFLINDRIWAAFRMRFGTVWFETIDGRAGSPVKLTPVPLSVRTMLARFRRPRVGDELREDDGVTIDGVEWQCLLILARKFTYIGGVTIGDHKDDGTTAKLFSTMADKKEKTAKERLDNKMIELVNPAARS